MIPRSCTSYATGLVGLLGFAAGMWMATFYQLPTAVRVIVVVSATSLPMVLWGILFDRVMERPTAGLAGPSPTGTCSGSILNCLALPLLLRWPSPTGCSDLRQPLYPTFFDLLVLTLPWFGAAGCSTSTGSMRAWRSRRTVLGTSVR